MLRKTMIALGAIAFTGALAISTTAEARMGGWRSGGFSGMRAGFVGGPRFAGIRSAGFARPGFGRVGFFPQRHAAFVPRFRHHRRFFAAPLFVGASLYPAYAYSSYYYDDPCWVVRYTPWGPRAVYVCGYY